MRPDPKDIVGTFLARSFNLKQSQIDALVVTLGIPVMALAHDADGCGLAVGMLRVERQKAGFDFTDDEMVKPVVGLVAWDRDGYPQDVVAWSPRDGWFGSWLGQAVVLGEHLLDAPRLGEPLRAFLDVGAWMQAGRDGVVIVDRKHAWWLLDGIRLEAEGIEDRVALRKILTPPRPDIVLRGANQDAVEKAVA